MSYEIADCTRTVGFHRFVGAAKTQVKEKVRTATIAPTVMEAITAKDPKGSRSRLCSVHWRRADHYTARIERYRGRVQDVLRVMYGGEDETSYVQSGCETRYGGREHLACYPLSILCGLHEWTGCFVSRPRRSAPRPATPISSDC